MPDVSYPAVNSRGPQRKCVFPGRGRRFSRRNRLENQTVCPTSGRLVDFRAPRFFEYSALVAKDTKDPLTAVTASGRKLAFAAYVNHVYLPPDPESAQQVAGQALGEIAAAAFDAPLYAGQTGAAP